MKFRAKRISTGVLIALVAILSVFQNCTHSQDGVLQTSSTTNSKGGGEFYDGKTYIESTGPTALCPDGLNATIVVYDQNTAILTRDNCKQLNPPKALTSNDFYIDSVNPDILHYGSRVFGAEFPSQVWARDSQNLNNLFLSTGTNPPAASYGHVGLGTEHPEAALHIDGGDFLLRDENGKAAHLILDATPAGGHNWILGAGDPVNGWGAGPSFAIYDMSQPYGSAQAMPFVIDVYGRIGINTATPSYTLTVVGDAGLSTGTAWTMLSDARLKDIQGDYEYGLNEVLQLHTVRYNYKKDNPLGLPSDRPMTGFIAQDVQGVIPDAVRTRADGYLELNADPIHWAVVNAVQQLNGKCEDLRAEVERLNSLNADLQQKLNALDERLRALEQR
jgi:hypothetical protein